jgi:hypothetical protein
MTSHIGVAIYEAGAAIVGAERADNGALLVDRIERLPADLSAAVARLETVGADVYVVADHDGLGRALWGALGDRGASWSLYTGRGLARQELVDRLLVAIHQDAVRFAAGLAEQEAMTAALVGYRRAVREDGLIGGALTVALLLSLIPPPVPAEPPQFAWGSSPFGPPDDDGALVAGLRLRRAPDGSLVGVQEPTDPPEAA